jgi:Carbohydrate esterase, sialic acid-specific acetylesterase
MGLTIRHATQSNVQDEGVPGEIGPTEWNEGHTITDGEPIVILATGQSNFVQTPAFAWSPESRARRWNYNHTDGHVGNAFVALPSITISVVDKFASEIARLNPTRSVYGINTAIATPGQTISRWLAGGGPPDMYQQITNNIPAALAAIGASKIDILLWWQGEAQTPATSKMYEYPTDWEAFHGRLLLETWFPRTTPVIIFGLAPTSISSDGLATDITNGNLQAVVRADPDCRRFVYTGSLAASFWLDAYHPTGAGYDQIGKMAAAEFVYGPTRNALIDPVRSVLRPQVLGRPALRNLIVGGDFTTNPWQRGTSFTSAANGSYADRWTWVGVGGGVVDITKTADAPTAAQAGVFSQHCLDVAVTTADTSIAATDQYFVRQILEGLNTAFLGFGQAGARPITISFWVKAAKTGTRWIALRNAAGNRSYNTSYTINASNTWERKIITIPGDTSGTWLYDNQHGIAVTWVLACGTNFIFTPHTWNAGNFHAGADPTVNEMDAIGNHFKLGLVQVEEGIGASPFEALPQDIVLDRCRRYYRKSFQQATAPAQSVGSVVGAAFAVSHVASAVFGTRVEFDTSMRAAPTITTYNPSAANANWRDTTNGADRTVMVSDQSEGGFVVTGATGAAAALNYIHWQASAEL